MSIISWPDLEVLTYSMCLVQWWRGFSHLYLGPVSEHWTPHTLGHRLWLWNMAALENNGFLVASHLILLESFLPFSLNVFLRPCRLFVTGHSMGLWSRLSILAISKVLHFSKRLTIVDVSESVRSFFSPILPEEKELPNNYAHLI